MADKNIPSQIWRHSGGEGGYSYLDDMTDKELADQAVMHRSNDHIIAADAANNQKRFERYEQQKREEQAKKFDLTLRIGVFFDGTGNNASNAAEGQHCGAHHALKPEDLDSSCKPYMSDSSSSYGNDPSNVYKLYDLYEHTERVESGDTPKSIRRKLYLDGIGTKTREQDSKWGAGTGRGDTGVEERVKLAFEKILNLMDALHQEHPNAEIRALMFDTFGFSRGAAAARHFSNQVLGGPNGPLAQVLQRTKAKFSRVFLPDSCDISVRFVGLFDTVASVAGLRNFGNYSSRHTPGIQLYLDRKKFPTVVQLAARDEIRFNFALRHVRPDHMDITLPGAHSDIGGGYRQLMEEALMVTPMQAQEIDQTQDIRETSIYHDAEHAKARWIEEGWPADALHIVTPKAEQLPFDRQDHMAQARKRVYAGLQIRREVRGELSRVYLRVMHALAKAKQVPFNDIPDKPEYHVPQELQTLCDRFVAGDYSLTPTEDALLRRRYIHTSAHWNHPNGKEKGGGLALIYLNSPMEDGVRVRHPHTPG